MAGTGDIRSQRMLSIYEYLNNSRTMLYSLISIAPLILIYEITALILGKNYFTNIRNQADFLFKEIFQIWGVQKISTFLLLLLFVVFFAVIFKERKTTPVVLNYFFIMILESAFYAAFLGFFIIHTTHLLLMIHPVLEMLHLNVFVAVGAGIYEEIIFRAFLFACTGYTLNRYFGVHTFLAYGISALFSSIIFSWMHYLGAEPFTWFSALFRFLFGLIFCVLYQFRGLGIACWTHVLYDIFVL